MADTQVPNFNEYARIHQKIEVGAGLKAVGERSLNRVIITKQGMNHKQRTLETVEENLLSLVRWVGEAERTEAEKRVARSLYYQYCENKKNLKTQMRRLTVVMGRQENATQSRCV